MMSQVDDLIRRSDGIADLTNACQGARRLRSDMESRLGGDRSKRSADEFRKKLTSLQEKIERFHADNPQAAADARQRLPLGSSANLERKVLKDAMNMAYDYETIVNLHVKPNENEKIRVGQLINDLANNERVHPDVIQAARDAHNDPQRLVDNLTKLVRRDPPVLSVVNPR